MDENRISDQLNDAANDAKNGVTAAMGTLSDLAGRARSAAVEAVNTIQGAAIETGKQVRDAAAKTYRQGARAGEYVSRNTAEQPMLALADCRCDRVRYCLYDLPRLTGQTPAAPASEKDLMADHSAADHRRQPL